MKTKNRQLFWASIIGNVLDHYDTALYGLIAPILAPLFFPNKDATRSLLFTYLLMSVSLISKPLGSLFFGSLSLKRGPKQALMFSLCGIGLSTGAMGILPTYTKIGALAPFLLSGCRLIQGFFAAGEQSIGNLFLLEKIQEKNRGKVNSAFNSSCVVGIFMASISVILVLHSKTPSSLWRLPFLAGSLTALIGLYVRKRLPETPHSPKAPFLKPSLKTNTGPFLRIILASGLTYLTYSVPFVFFNHFIPLVTNITLSQMIHYNSLFLLIDFLLLPLFGTLSDRFNPIRWMAFSSLLLAITTIPLFLLLPQAGLFTVLSIRLWIVLLGLAFLAPLQGWFFSLFSRDQCYLLSGLGYSLGVELLGKTTPTICLFLWYQFQTPIAPASYVLFIALGAGVAVLTGPQKAPRIALSQERNLNR